MSSSTAARPYVDRPTCALVQVFTRYTAPSSLISTPMAMVICQQKDVNYTTKHRLLKEAATNLNSVDLENAKLGDPKIPTTPYGVATIIGCQLLTFINGFIIYCSIARHLRDVSSILKKSRQIQQHAGLQVEIRRRDLMASHGLHHQVLLLCSNPTPTSSAPPGRTIPFPPLF